MVVGMFASIGIMIKAYTFSFSFNQQYEDALDQLLFNYVKK